MIPPSFWYSALMTWLAVSSLSSSVCFLRPKVSLKPKKMMRMKIQAKMRSTTMAGKPMTSQEVKLMDDDAYNLDETNKLRD